MRYLGDYLVSLQSKITHNGKTESHKSNFG